MTTSQDYRRSARKNAAKAVQLMQGRAGLTPVQQTAVLQAATQYLANAMAHAAAAVAALEIEQAATAVDIPAAAEDLVAGLEKMLEEKK